MSNGQKIIDGMKDAIAYAKGDKTAASVTVVEFERDENGKVKILNMYEED